MKQRTIWMLLLIFGTVSNFYSCKTETEYRYFKELHLINDSGYDLSIETFNKIPRVDIDTFLLIKDKYCILKNDSLYQEIEFDGHVLGGDFYITLSDSVSIVFESENERVVSFIRPQDMKSKFNILSHDNHKHNRISERRDEYTYTFTNDDFENAVEIKKEE